MPYRVVKFTVKNRAAAVALGATALVLGGVLLALGITLLVGVAVVGTAVGTGVMLYRRLAGRGAPRVNGAARLDPRLEVFAEPPRMDARRLR